VRKVSKEHYNGIKELYSNELLSGRNKDSIPIRFLKLRIRFFAGIYNYDEQMTEDALTELTMIMTHMQTVEESNGISSTLTLETLKKMWEQYKSLVDISYFKKE
jgi:hypothetical protein